MASGSGSQGAASGQITAQQALDRELAHQLMISGDGSDSSIQMAPVFLPSPTALVLTLPDQQPMNLFSYYTTLTLSLLPVFLSTFSLSIR